MPKDRYSPKMYPTLEKLHSDQWTPSQGIVQRNFPTFEGMKKFYCVNNATKCIKYPSNRRSHLKTVRRLWFPTSDRLETWPFPLERYGLDNITGQPWSHAICPRTTSDSAYFCVVTLFSSKRTRQSTKTDGMRADCVRPWSTRDIVRSETM